MAAVTCREMRSAESRAISSGWTEERLLDLAGTRLGIALGRYFPNPGTAVAYLGKGHNAGDALVALAVLRHRFHWKIAVRHACQIDDCAPLTRRKWQQLTADHSVPDGPIDPCDVHYPLLLIDGLLGIGGRGPLDGPLLALANEMRRLRDHNGARIAAVDQPSGMDADDGTAFPGCVTADATFMIGNAKHGLLLGRAADHVGALALVPVGPLETQGTSELCLIAPQISCAAKSHRPFDFHKGMAGHVAIIAGSKLYPGAAVMAAIGALRGGAGLVTLHVPADAMPLIAPKCPPEVILRTLHSPDDCIAIHSDALVIGCGLGNPGPEWENTLLARIANPEIPTVLDADGLNLIARHSANNLLKDHHILTPHPGEFRRLAPELADLPRENAVRAFVETCPSTLLLKGARTLITRQGSPIWCNSTGSPAMSTGGQGDLLAGVIGALLASGIESATSACLGAWLCGRASEIALHLTPFSEESLLPTDTALYLGAAFTDWKSSHR